MSSPSMASRRWRTSSSQRRAAPPAPQRAGHRGGLGRLAPEAPPQRSTSVAVGSRARGVGAPAGAGDDVAVVGRERQPVEIGRRRGQRRGAGGERAEVARARPAGSAIARARRARTASPSSARPEPVALEREQRRRLRLAQQQPQLGAHPRAGDRLDARRRRPPRRPTDRCAPPVRTRAGRRSGPGAAGASGRRGTIRRAGRAGGRRAGPPRAPGSQVSSPSARCRAIALTVKSRRSRSSRSEAPSSTSGSAPGRA